MAVVDRRDRFLARLDAFEPIGVMIVLLYNSTFAVPEISFGLLASSAFKFLCGEPAAAFSAPRETKIQPSSPMKRMPLGNLSLTWTRMLPG